MIQVLPAKRTFGSEFGRAFGGGLGKGFSEGVSDSLKGKQEKKEKEERDKQEKARYEEENESAKRLGIDLSGITDPKMRQQVVAESLKGQRKEDELKKRHELLKGLFGEDKQQLTQTQEKPSELNTIDEEPKKKKGFKYSDITKEKRAQIALTDPQASKALEHMADVETREAREETKADERRKDKIRAETLPFRQDLAQRAEAAERDLTAKKESLELINSGKLDHPLVATFLESLPGKMGLSFLSPETVQYKASLVQGYGALKNLFAGATRVKEIEILENKIADTYLTDEQKIAVINSMSRASQNDITMAEAAQEVEQESEDSGKPLGILEFRKKIQERAKQKTDALFNRMMDEQEAIFKDAENIKKSPLDYNNPEHKKIISQIMQEAKLITKDPKKIQAEAEKIAKKKGYHW